LSKSREQMKIPLFKKQRRSKVAAFRLPAELNFINFLPITLNSFREHAYLQLFCVITTFVELKG